MDAGAGRRHRPGQGPEPGSRIRGSRAVGQDVDVGTGCGLVVVVFGDEVVVLGAGLTVVFFVVVVFAGVVVFFAADVELVGAVVV